MDTVYNGGYATSIILDNRTTGMTGLQEHAGTGYTLKGEPSNMVDYEQLVRALGIKHIAKIDPYNVKATMETLKEEMNRDAASVVITQNGPCMLHRREKRKFASTPSTSSMWTLVEGARCVSSWAAPR